MEARNRDPEDALWFGGEPPIGNLSLAVAVKKVREFGDSTTADTIAAAEAAQASDTFASPGGVIGAIFSRYLKTINVCGFLPAAGGELRAVTDVKPDPSLQGKALKVTLDGLHVANYPGFGTHKLLFDFAVQTQVKGRSGIFHYNARFEARDRETVPVRNFPLFYGLKPSLEGITFGFQIVNLSSSFDEGLLDFLKRDEFKTGLNLAASVTPVVGQISEMAASLTRWLSGQSRNTKVHEFRQGLDFEKRPFGGGLASGSYLVIQIPQHTEREWNWNDWVVDSQSTRVVRRDDRKQPLDFNHLAFGLHRMEA
jgi:hypothetical protein